MLRVDFVHRHFLQATKIFAMSLMSDMGRWIRLHDCTAWVFWEKGWNVQLYCSAIDCLPSWDGASIEPHNGYCWHVSLGNTFYYHGDWTVDADWTHGTGESYTFFLGSLWVRVSSMWHNDATGYGQLLLDQGAVKEQLAPCLSLDLPFAPHLSFRQTFI